MFPLSMSLQDLMVEASWLTHAGRLHEAGEAMQRALLGGGVPSSELDASVSDQGEFISGSHQRGAQSLDYKLYLPPGHGVRSLPLVLMLHGCGQDPDDFAAGTGMNDRARQLGAQGFYVLYAAQSQQANPQRCWNWFKHNHQGRARGEPALLAAMVQKVMAQHKVDARRVYVAGLSAGAAMAAIVAAAYPDIFAAVGVHSGLAPGVARDASQALSVMGNGMVDAAASAVRVPTIVFHGDQDGTVHPRNGEQVIAALLNGTDTVTVARGEAPKGRGYTLATHVAKGGKVLAEHWLLHGGGHAWSGGQSAGSFTDSRGPDATGEMLRFFRAHPLPAAR